MPGEQGWGCNDEDDAQNSDASSNNPKGFGITISIRPVHGHVHSTSCGDWLYPSAGDVQPPVAVGASIWYIHGNWSNRILQQ